MARTIRKLMQPVLLALGVSVLFVTASLLHASWIHGSWSPVTSSAIAAPAKKTGVAALRQAQKLLQRGKAKKAAGLLDGAISSGSLAGSNMAVALYYRGLALRKMGKPAQAVADFTNALWLKNGLSASMRGDAERNRTAAYREAGIAGVGAPRKVAVAPPVRRVQAQRRTQAPQANIARVRRPAQPAARRPVAAVKPPLVATKPKSSSSGIGGFFSNLFGGGDKKTEDVAQSVPTTVQAQPQGALRVSQGTLRADDHITQVSAWSKRTEVQPRAGGAEPQRPIAQVRQNRQNRVVPRRAGPVRTRAAARKPASRRVASIRRRPQGRSSVGAVRAVPKRRYSYGLILSPVRSLKVANANAVTVKQRFGQVLGQRQPIVEQMSFGGSMFYQVRIGPFANAAPPSSVCAKLKAAGIDCILAKR